MAGFARSGRLTLKRIILFDLNQGASSRGVRQAFQKRVIFNDPNIAALECLGLNQIRSRYVFEASARFSAAFL